MESFFVLPVLAAVLLGFIVMPASAGSMNPGSAATIPEWIQSVWDSWFNPPVVHGAEIGLGADDHKQYFLLSGRSPAQVVKGTTQNALYVCGTILSGSVNIYSGNTTFISQDPDELPVVMQTDHDGYFDIEAPSGWMIYNPSGGTSFRRSSIEVMRIDDAAPGKVGIGITSTTAQLDTSGTVRFRNFGAGTLMTDANGNLYVISDEKLKTNIIPSASGLSAVLGINPVKYHYSVDSGLDTQNEYIGFSAEQLRGVLPEAVYSKPDVKYEIKQILKKDNKTNGAIDDYQTVESPVLDKNGKQTVTLSVSDRAIIAALVNAVKEQQKEIEDLQARCR